MLHPSTVFQWGNSCLRDSTASPRSPTSVPWLPTYPVLLRMFTKRGSRVQKSRSSGRNHPALPWAQNSPLRKTGLIKQESSPPLVTELPVQFASLGSRGQKQPSPSPQAHPKLTVHPLAPSRAQTRHLPPSSSSTQSFENPSKPLNT